ncbi:tail fiber protein [Photorhabdus tasmaniensis]|uniref:tail fiber protein n=1 Tax=Photorhabdus sp. RM323S TaxID=3342828 RepID=UPI0036DEB317
MSHKNDFKAFSINDNANVVSQGKYEESERLSTGFPPNDVPTHLLNKVLRQASTISSVVADFIATRSGNDVLDDGNIVKLTAQLNKALEQKITTDIPSASLTQKGVVQLTNVIGNSDTLAVTQKLVQEVINSLREYTREEIDNRIKTANEIPIGSPIPWPLPHPPIGYFTCNGSAFNKLQYPKLAEAYPDGRLPDLRGEFIRGWDDGRGVDSSRSLLSWQEGSYLVQEVNNPPDSIVNFSLNDRVALQWDIPKNQAISVRARGVTADRGTWTTAAAYIGISRPRNIAFNYVVRAA